MESGNESKSGMTETWMRKHDLLFIGATNHPSIQSIRDANLHLSSFKNWLGQEYWLVRTALIPFLTKILQKAREQPDDTTDIEEIIETGMSFQKDEISWLENEASEKLHLPLSSVAPQQPTTDYCNFLENITSPEVKFPVALTILWAMESVCHRSFARCLESDSRAPEEMKEVCRKCGGDDAFGEYCVSLQSAADRTLEKASNDVIVKAEVILLQFLEIVVEFWNLNVRAVQPNAA